MTKIAVIAGSPSNGSRLFGLIQHATDRLARAGYDVDLISAADLPAEELLRANFNSPAIQEALSSVDEADAVIIASPVFKASYSGALKTVLDLVPQKGFQGKIVLPLFIGGTIAHLLAVDYALKPVVAALGGTNILGGVFAVDGWVSRTEHGGYELTEQLRERLDAAIGDLIDELGHYASAPNRTEQGQAV
ncbi:NADPH-dependent FMN reductase [Paenibacillus cookii]|uniref:FMN reductase (NADPH) n=1 Tax=Paenibacillus cookii TaxID=157839 RepID=A0ABQ4LXA0_9BACL|nr:NADPH-dependent FMN reductase [Paenibacillus cookii]KHF35942.1 FMN reductase (NADPH) [Paenibacillus sp. P1XP2]GIO67902.1 FMN reductase (NADPH) [Paenibacillus cookii]